MSRFWSPKSSNFCFLILIGKFYHSQSRIFLNIFLENLFRNFLENLFRNFFRKFTRNIILTNRYNKCLIGDIFWCKCPNCGRNLFIIFMPSTFGNSSHSHQIHCRNFIFNKSSKKGSKVSVNFSHKLRSL